MSEGAPIGRVVSDGRGAMSARPVRMAIMPRMKRGQPPPPAGPLCRPANCAETSAAGGRVSCACVAGDGSRFIFRKSGTGSSGTTIRVYLEKFSKIAVMEVDKALEEISKRALDLSKIH